MCMKTHGVVIVTGEHMHRCLRVLSINLAHWIPGTISSEQGILIFIRKQSCIYKKQDPRQLVTGTATAILAPECGHAEALCSIK